MGTLEGQRPKRLNYGRPQIDLAKTRLTPEEIQAIREKARAKVELELKDREEADLLAQFVEEARRAHDPKEELHPLFLQLAPSQPWIMLDGTQYLDGHTYRVRQAVYDVLVEQMGRGWAHEELTQVRSDSGYSRRPSHIGTGNFVGQRAPRNLVVSAGALEGSSARSLLGLPA